MCWIVVVGNLFVMALEGLFVGIQVLRLNFTRYSAASLMQTAGPLPRFASKALRSARKLDRGGPKHLFHFEMLRAVRAQRRKILMKQMKHKARILLVLALALVLACAFSSPGICRRRKRRSARRYEQRPGLPGRGPRAWALQALAPASPWARGAPGRHWRLTEDPKSFGKALIFVALGEGIALLHMLISILILSRL